MTHTAQNRISIRAAGPDDASAVASVLNQSFAEYKHLYTPEAFAATAPAAEEVLRRMREGPVWVALCYGVSVVGTGAAVPKGEALYVRGMAVLPEARGRGVGRLLLGHVEAFASSRGYRRLELSTTPFLHAAIRLYERAGFRRVGEGPRDLFETPLFSMVKDLGGGS